MMRMKQISRLMIPVIAVFAIGQLTLPTQAVIAQEGCDTHAHGVFYGSHGMRATIPAGATYGLANFYSGLSNPPLNSSIPASGTISKLYMGTAGAQPATGSLVATLYIGGSATSVEITIAAGTGVGTFSDTDHSAAYTSGQTIRLSIKNNAGAASAPIGFIAFEFMQDYTPCNTPTPIVFPATPTQITFPDTPTPGGEPVGIGTPYYRGRVTYGDMGRVNALACLISVAVLWLLAWIVVSFMDRNRRPRQ